VALLSGCAPSSDVAPRDPRLDAAENLIDAFYSFDPAPLRTALRDAPQSTPQILYYQGWAQGGNYVVLNRKPCSLSADDIVSCEITVKDDLIGALGTGYDVTDIFRMSFSEGRIVAVDTASNDPPEFEQALDWLRATRPDLMQGPCKEFFNGGPTPQDCVRNVVSGFRDYAARTPD